MNYDKLFDACNTKRQTEVLQAVKDNAGNTARAANALGTSKSNIQHTISRIKARANQHYKDGFKLERQTVQRDNQGNIQRTWDKIKATDLRNGEFIEHIKEVFETYKGKFPKVKAPKKTHDDLMTMYPMGDPHIGMLAHKDITGKNFDTKIAEKNLVTAMSHLVHQAPKSKYCVILNLGDFFHTDDSSNRTKRSGNQLDVDGRWGKIYQIGLNIMIQLVQLALEKHEIVDVRNVIGNHDEHTAQTLSVALAAFFHGNSRVSIDTSGRHFWYHRFGNNLFGSTHGDMCKPNDLPLIMANDRQEDWGACDFRYWHTGHIHHDHVKDYVGCRWESHRTLAYQDSWHNSAGYRSQQDMKAITYHKKYGEVSRLTINVKQITDAAK